jgi:hypothetical protein
MYVKTTAVEDLATTVSTTHITFLWTMIALVAGAVVTAGCLSARKKSKGDDSDDEEESKPSSSGSDSDSD